MGRKLTEAELGWVNALFKPHFKGKDILYQQIMNSEVVRHDGGNTIRLEFEVGCGITRYPYKVNTPVGLQLRCGADFELHVIGGVVEALTLTTRFSNCLDDSLIRLDEIYSHRVHAEVAQDEAFHRRWIPVAADRNLGSQRIRQEQDTRFSAEQEAKRTMSRKLTETELGWVNALFKPHFKGKDILYQQIMNSEVVRYEDGSTIWLEFYVEGNVERYPYNACMPVSMTQLREGKSPLNYLLHLVDGVVKELEVLVYDFTEELDDSMINPEKVDYYGLYAKII